MVAILASAPPRAAIHAGRFSADLGAQLGGITIAPGTTGKAPATAQGKAGKLPELPEPLPELHKTAPSAVTAAE